METVVKDLPDISQYENINHIPYLLAGILLVDVIVMFGTRYFPEKVGGETLNRWYDAFGLEGVIADVFIILIGFVIAQVLYTTYIRPTYGWKPFLFMLLVVGVQAIHDIIFYLGVIKPIPVGHNDMMDIYKDYAEENGGAIILGDSGLMIGSGLATFALESMPAWAASMVAIATVYTLPYILNTKMKSSYRWKPSPGKAPASAPTPVQEKAPQQPQQKVANDPIKVPISPWDNLRGTGGASSLEGLTAANQW